MSVSFGKGRLNLSLLLAASFMVLATAHVAAGQSIPAELVSYPDMILHNGKVLTVDDRFTVAEAIAMRDGKVLKVGTSKDVLALKGPATQMMDLQGRSVVPGFIDPHGHGHFMSQRGSGMADGGDLVCETVEKCLEEIRAGAAKAKPGAWVRYGGVRNDVLINQMDRWDFDKVTPNNPIWIASACCTSWLNTLAWNQVKDLIGDMDGAFKDPKTKEPNGHIRGQANGVLDHSFSAWAKEWWGPKTLDEQKHRLRVLNSHGVTMNAGRATGMGLSVLNELRRKGELTVRVRPIMEFVMLNPEAENYLKRVGNLTGVGDDWLRIPGMTISAPDGQTNEGGSMSTIVPRNVLNQPGGVPWDMKGNDRYLAGENKWAASREDMDWRGAGTEFETIVLANRYGWSIQGVHTQGDIGAKMMLEAYEKANAERPIAGRYFAFDHGMIRTEEDLKRAVKMDVTNSFNSNYVFGPNNKGQIYMFGEQIHSFSPVKAALETGLKPALEMEGQFQEDKVAALVAIQRFVTRQDEQGRTWGLRQAVTREEALRMATIWNARYTGDEKVAGSLEPGKLADMVVLQGDYMTVPPEKIREILLDFTIVNGKVVYDRVKDGPIKRGPRATEGH